MDRKCSCVVFVIALTVGLLACASIAAARESAPPGEALAQVLQRDPAQPNATIYFAKPGGASAGACDSWANACDLQYALTTAISDAEIWVASGVYTPGIYLTSTFQLRSGVALYGGFALTETARDQRNWQANLTVLSGDIDGNDTTDANGVVTDTANLHGANAIHVLTASDTNATAVLDGLIVTAGNANGDGVHDPTYSGGGMYSSQGSSPVVRNVTFSGNRAWYDGGGWYADYHAASGSPILNNVLFTSNKSGNGGGGLCVRGDVNLTLNQVTFSGNQSSYGGGMVSNASGYLELTNMAFLGNSATSGCCYTYGGGLWLETVNASTMLNNLLLSGNWSQWYAGGMYIHGEVAMTNFTFSGNRAGNSGGALYIDGQQHTLVNAIVWGNSAPSAPQFLFDNGGTVSVTYSDVQGGYAGAGNIDLDPLFTTPITYTAAPTITGNYRLQITSPAIDAGNSLSVTVSADLDGKPRLADMAGVPDTGLGAPPIVDMGAYEVHWPTAVVGNNQSVKSAAVVTLDGSGSFDPGGNLPLAYGWTQTGGTPAVVLSSAIISHPTFTAPIVANQTTLTFTLVVTNSIGQVSTPAMVAITVNPVVADLSLSLTDGVAYAIPGNPITYTLVVANAGPDTANDAVVTDTLPGTLNGVTWTCIASGGSCSTPSGAGNLSTTVNLDAGGAVTFTIGGRLAPGAIGTLVNTAYVSHFSDPNPDNNYATDSDIVLHVKLYLPLVIK